jgi:predicted P-loop ATPase/GTPase
MYINDVESININTSEYLTVLAKTQKFIIVLLCLHISGITFFRYAQYHNIGKPNNLKVFESNKAKEPKH